MSAFTPGGLFRPRVSNKAHSKISTGDVMAFFQQLCTVFKAGTPLWEGLQIAATQTESTQLAVIVRQIADKVAAGTPLNQALLDHPKLFKREWTEVVRSGEDSGQLGKVLESLTAQMDAAQQMRSKIVSAMMYPAIIMVVAIGAVSVMLIHVVPTFATMFNDFGKKLPDITQAVLDFSAFLRERWPMIVCGIALTIFLVRQFLDTPGGKQFWHRLLVSLPLVGDIVVQSCMQKFAQNLALLLRAGLPLHDAIASLEGIFETNLVYRDAMASVGEKVGSGGSLASALEGTGVFTAFVCKMTRIGEESGTLTEVLDQTDNFYRRRVESVVLRITGTLETIAILGMGVAVSVILCAIYLPLFSMASGV
ncbi:MAG: type II secretion system F family protein [Planctomycetes bacterium]|nr:type II secretion system F family protein [Planctomycetota bacterium]